jgi:hypothetical protein
VPSSTVAPAGRHHRGFAGDFPWNPHPGCDGTYDRLAAGVGRGRGIRALSDARSSPEDLLLPPQTEGHAYLSQRGVGGPNAGFGTTADAPAVSPEPASVMIASRWLFSPAVMPRAPSH